MLIDPEINDPLKRPQTQLDFLLLKANRDNTELITKILTELLSTKLLSTKSNLSIPYREVKMAKYYPDIFCVHVFVVREVVEVQPS